MAQIFGELRTTPTEGEKKVYRSLRDNLPNDYYVFVECPIHFPREIRHPDFIILTNYGVIVLEIKDWLKVERATPHEAIVRDRSFQEHRFPNPVEDTRNLSIAMANLFEKDPDLLDERGRLRVRWQSAIVLTNLGSAELTQVRRVWGEEFVFGLAEVQNPDILRARLRNLVPEGRASTLTRVEIQAIKKIIYPEYIAESAGRPPVVLDDQQLSIAVEPIKAIEEKELIPEKQETQEVLFEITENDKPQEAPVLSIAKNSSVRLVRGVAGSGKTIVLMQRAKYLAKNNPDWKIAIVTFNNDLAEHLRASTKGIASISVFTFHSLCFRLLSACGQMKKASDSLPGYVRKNKQVSGSKNEDDYEFITDEITWIRDMGISSLQQYQRTERLGRGRIPSGLSREHVWQVNSEYQEFLDSQHLIDWADAPWLLLQNFDCLKEPPQFDAILVDEAQDFAPVWFQVLQKVHKPQGVFFLTDDPSQSIYRYYSWAQKGVHVVGRTRWLKVPYRNTTEIYQAAYAVIESDPILRSQIDKDEDLALPDLTSDILRHGEKPLLQKFISIEEEILSIKSSIELLLRKYHPKQIAVLTRHKNTVRKLERNLGMTQVVIDTLHSQKGLEYEVVFLVDLGDFSVDESNAESLSNAKRLLYMAMTRSKEKLVMSYSGNLPQLLRLPLPFVDHIQ